MRWDPKLLETRQALVIPLSEQKATHHVAVDAFLTVFRLHQPTAKKHGGARSGFCIHQ